MTLAALGWDDAWEAEAERDSSSAAGTVVARVSRVESVSARLLRPEGEVSVPAHGLVVGDWRMLTLAWASGAEPLVLLSKVDLDPPEVEGAVAAVESAAPGVEVVAVSATAGTGLSTLRGRLGTGRTFVLLGPSGAGKSTLVNAVAGAEVLTTGEVRGDGRGRHTTTHRQLVVVDGVGPLIDTPGVRTVGMTADEDGLERVFEDVLAYGGDCRYADCAHAVEPGCAVRAAVDAGVLDAARLESYLRLQREIEHQARRKGARERSVERRAGRAHNQIKAMVMRAKGR